MPPGSRQSATSNNTTNIVEEPVQVIKPDGSHDPIVLPAPPVGPVSKVDVSQPNGARDWKIVISGAAAEKMYKVMALKSGDTDRQHKDLNAQVKNGKHIECYSLNEGGYQCELILEGSTGELKVLNKDRKMEPFKADDLREDLYHTELMDINSGDNGGKLVFSPESGTDTEAKEIFDNLTDKSVRTVVLAADDDSGIYAEGKERKGVNVDCYQQFLKAKPNDAIYSCNFWILNSTTGEFDKIK